ncbi:MAG: aminotransferase class I/II-fold pyridoxal phosphate-dependent enzyme [Cyclobacteriaceae bacterium]
MAKSRHNNLLDTIGDLILHAKKEGLLHLYTEGDHFDGRYIQIKGKKLFHFGTTGYLGLEQDIRIKQAACDAIMRYGTQFPLSKTYVSFVIYKELEEALLQMYERPLVITKNSTLAHLGVIPSVVRDEDMLILDQQVHASVQNAAQLLKPRGIPVQLLRHNDMNMLEDLLKKYRNQYRHIWYAADGVYSMYGDTVPMGELLELKKKYPQLHLYVDDVHGMSWAGKHGTGYVMSQLGELPEQMVLVGTLSKSFGASGSVVVFGDQALYESYRIFGGPQTFSAQLEPASVAAALASARIHLSDEIYELQADLREKVNYCNELIRQTSLPLVQENVCPVHFIGSALPAAAYNFARRLMNEGFYINVAIFPAVPVRNSGIRFTISRHNQKEEIKALVDAMVHHYPESLREEGLTLNRVRAAFKLPPVEEPHDAAEVSEQLDVSVYHRISDINSQDWDYLFADKGIFNHSNLRLMESAFADNLLPEHNWNFVYLIIRDKKQHPVLATFFTAGLWKDDMLAKPEVSAPIEAIRMTDPYFMMSRVLCMGSQITDGDHLYVDRSHHMYKEALRMLCLQMEKLKKQMDAKTMIIRDLHADDTELNDFFHEQGFMKVDFPEASVLELTHFENEETFQATLTPRSRKHMRQDVLNRKHLFVIEHKAQLTDEELHTAYMLYLNVQKVNLALNITAYPYKLFSQMNESSEWEFICLYAATGEKPLIGVAMTHISPRTYQGVLVGLDYEYAEHKVYKQLLYRAVMRANALGKELIHLGVTANMEKKKLGARQFPKVGFIQTDANFSFEALEGLQGNKLLEKEY